VLQRAQFVRDEIEREAATKRDAISAIFSTDSSTPKTARGKAPSS